MCKKIITIITITERTITCPGSKRNLECESSLKLVNPPCPEGNEILLSAIQKFKSNDYIKIVVRIKKKSGCN